MTWDQKAWSIPRVTHSSSLPYVSPLSTAVMATTRKGNPHTNIIIVNFFWLLSIRLWGFNCQNRDIDVMDNDHTKHVTQILQIYQQILRPKLIYITQTLYEPKTSRLVLKREFHLYS